MPQQQNPKALINQFYQRAKAALPVYKVTPAPVDGQETRFVCTLTLPAVTVEDDNLPEQIFQEEGSSKKAAQDAAAATAFRFLSEQPVYRSVKPYEESFLRTLATRVLSPQGMFRDPEIHGAAVISVAYLDGFLPLAALPHSRILRGWAKEYGKTYDSDLGSDPMALIDVVRRELTAQAAAAVSPEAAAAASESGTAETAHAKQPREPVVAMASGAVTEGAAAGAAAALALGLGPNGLCVRLPKETAEVAPPGVISEEVDPSVMAAGGMATLVVIPADISLPLREETVPARGCLLSRVAELLACPSPHHVLQWGRVGRKVSFAADPRLALVRAAALAAEEVPPVKDSSEPSAEAPDLSKEAPRMTHSIIGSVGFEGNGRGGGGGGGGGGEETVLPAESESEAASAPAAIAEDHFAAPPPRTRSRPRAVSAALAGTDTPAGSEQSICLPPPAVGGGEVTGRMVTHDLQLSPVATGPACAAGGGAGGIVEAVQFVQPPASPGAYRVNSTITLAVQRGPAAMDWETDGPSEVRGPEHVSAPTGGGGGGGVSRVCKPGSSFGAGRVTHIHGTRRSGSRHQGLAHHPPGASGAAVANRSGAGPAAGGVTADGDAARLGVLGIPRGSGNGGGGGNTNNNNNAGGSSPRHPNMHPSLISLPEPSLFSKLLLPPLPALSPRGRRSLDVGATAEPPLLASLRNATAAAATSRCDDTGSDGPSGLSNAAQPYSIDGEALNARATWLAGKPVYGDAIATTCRLSPSEARKTLHVMKWRNYRPVDEWCTANAITPAAAYVRSAHAPLLLRGLPAEYRGATWVGPLPRQLLDSYVAAHPPAAAITSLELVVPDVDLPGEGVAELLGTNFLGLPYKVTTGPGPLEVVAQQAALSALLKLQALDAACLAGPLTPEQLSGAGQKPEQQRQQAGAATQPTVIGSEVPKQATTAVPMTAVAMGADEAAKQGAAVPAGSEVALVLGPVPVGSEEVEIVVEVLEPGLVHARRPQEGAMVKVAYTISLPAEGAQVEVEVEGNTEAEQDGASSEGGHRGPLVLEQNRGLILAVGAAGAPAVPPVVDHAIQQLRVGGKARCRLSTALEGADFVGAGFPHLDTQLELTLLHASLPVVDGRAAKAGPGPPLFTPPLGQQRMEAVAALLRRENVATLVDLGCGECKLLEGLLLARHGADCGGPLRRVVGLDISRKALDGAAKRLGKLAAAAEEVEHLELRGEESVPKPVEVRLYQGSAMSDVVRYAGNQVEAEAAGGADAGAAPWIGLRGCDAVALVEVVEHLDPEPLQLFGPCVLGSLRPRLLLVTTPNWEYNAVMRSCEQLAARAAATRNCKGAPSPASSPPGGNWPGPPGRDGLPLRCGDHRFEWTRQEFRSWAEGLAAVWGYSVHFEGIGRANNEEETLQAPGYGGAPEPGAATQMAVFRRKEGDMEVKQPRPARGDRQQPLGLGTGEGWELVWGPAFVAAPREELEEAEAEVEAEDAAEARRRALVAAAGAVGEGPQLEMRTSSTALSAGAEATGVKRMIWDADAGAAESAAGKCGDGGSGGCGAPRGGCELPPVKRQAVGGSGCPDRLTSGDPIREDPHSDPPGVEEF